MVLYIRTAVRTACLRGYYQFCRFQPHYMSTATNDSATSKLTRATNYSANLVKESDINDYVATLLIPSDNRNAIFVIKAFAAEIGKISLKPAEDPVMQQQAGISVQIRFQWWRDALEKIYSQAPPEQPIATALASLNLQSNLSKDWLLRIVDSREQLLLDDPPTNIADFEDYAESAGSSLLYLCLESLKCKNENANRAASHLGKAIALTNIIRSIPAMAAKDSIWLPEDVIDRHDISFGDIYDIMQDHDKIAKSDDDSLIALAKAVNELACVADVHLAKARMLRKLVPRKSASVFLPAINTRNYLRKLRTCDYNVFHPNLHTPPSPWEFLMGRMQLFSGRYWRIY